MDSGDFLGVVAGLVVGQKSGSNSLYQETRKPANSQSELWKIPAHILPSLVSCLNSLIAEVFSVPVKTDAVAAASSFKPPP
jgi:hypothetical protein